MSNQTLYSTYFYLNELNNSVHRYQANASIALEALDELKVLIELKKKTLSLGGLDSSGCDMLHFLAKQQMKSLGWNSRISTESINDTHFQHLAIEDISSAIKGTFENLKTFLSKSLKDIGDFFKSLISATEALKIQREHLVEKLNAYSEEISKKDITNQKLAEAFTLENGFSSKNVEAVLIAHNTTLPAIILAIGEIGDEMVRLMNEFADKKWFEDPAKFNMQEKIKKIFEKEFLAIKGFKKTSTNPLVLEFGNLINNQAMIIELSNDFSKPSDTAINYIKKKAQAPDTIPSLSKQEIEFVLKATDSSIRQIEIFSATFKAVYGVRMDKAFEKMFDLYGRMEDEGGPDDYLHILNIPSIVIITLMYDYFREVKKLPALTIEADKKALDYAEQSLS